MLLFFFFFSSRRRHTRCSRDWSSDVCSSDLEPDGSNFPTSQAPQSNFGGGYADAFVAKFDPSGSALIYSTFLGGSGGDQGSGIAMDANGNAFVIGDTYSTDFPTANAMQPVIRGGWSPDLFVAKISPSPTP